jgi:hypothetical protein
MASSLAQRILLRNKFCSAPPLASVAATRRPSLKAFDWLPVALALFVFCSPVYSSPIIPSSTD